MNAPNFLIRPFCCLFFMLLLAINKAQVSIGSAVPQGIFSIDGGKDNPSSGIPDAKQQANDFVVKEDGRVGIGTATPGTSAILELSSQNKGLLLPRVQSVYQISNPEEGMFAYSKAYKSAMVYDGAYWSAVTPPQNLSTTIANQRFEDLLVTNGSQWLKRINDKTNLLGIYDGTSRAEVNSHIFVSKSSRIRFKYLGNTPNDITLANGDIVRQIGLKVTTSNTCNVMYVMWNIEKKLSSGIVQPEKLDISLKRNDGMSTQVQCGDSGYVYIGTGATYANPFPPISSAKDGKEHSLEATLVPVPNTSDKYTLVVWADQLEVWRNIVEVPSSFFGTSGIRTDNGKFEFFFDTDYYH